MIKLLLVIVPSMLVAGSLLSSGCGGDSCVYGLHDDKTREQIEVSDFPENALPLGIFDQASRQQKAGLLVALSKPSDPSFDKSIIIPPCKQAEALVIIDRRQAQDKEQEQRGVTREARRYD